MANRQNTVARVFWPSHYRNTRSGYLIGWNIRSFIWCVSCVVPFNDIQPEQLENALKRIKTDSKLQEIHQYCSGTPFIIGLVENKDEQGEEAMSGVLRSFIESKIEEQHIWLTISLKTPNEGSNLLSVRNKRGETCSFHRSPDYSKKKELLEVGEKKFTHIKTSCFGYEYFPHSQIVFYHLPTKGHYYSSAPMNLDIFHEDCPIISRIKQSELEQTLHQVNCSLMIDEALQEAIEQEKTHIIPPASDSSSASTHSERDSESDSPSAPDVPVVEPEVVHVESSQINDREKTRENVRRMRRKCQNTASVPKRLLWYLIELISTICVLAYSVEGVLAGIKWPQQLLDWLQMSSTFQQIRMRFALAKQLPFVWLSMHAKWQSHAQTRKYSVNFYNIFYLITIDTLLGVACTLFFMTHADDIIVWINQTTSFFTQSIIVSNIEWLMGWPAGFKLNDNVDSFMGQLFLFYNSKWTEYLYLMVPMSYYHFIVLVGSSGILGLSMMLSVVSDLLWICTLHINWFYNASARIYMHQLEAISGLWKLFRGKKRNVLRNRIDSCDFDIDQLLLGTILFTVLFFLFPTVAIYYLYFTLVRFLMFAVQTFIFTLLQLLNHFPIYGFFLYFIDSSLFSGGIFLQVVGHCESTTSTAKQNCAYFVLRNQPSSVGVVFYYFKNLASEFFQNNSIPALISCALFGMPIQLAIRPSVNL